MRGQAHWHIYDDSSVCWHTHSLIRYYIWSQFTNVTMFYLTFHYTVYQCWPFSLTVFYSLMPDSVIRSYLLFLETSKVTLNLWMEQHTSSCVIQGTYTIWNLKEASRKTCFALVHVHFPNQLTHNVNVIFFFYLRRTTVQHRADWMWSALFMPMALAEMSRSHVQGHDSDICICLSSEVTSWSFFQLIKMYFFVILKKKKNLIILT